MSLYVRYALLNTCEINIFVTYASFRMESYLRRVRAPQSSCVGGLVVGCPLMINIILPQFVSTIIFTNITWEKRKMGTFTQISFWPQICNPPNVLNFWNGLLYLSSWYLMAQLKERKDIYRYIASLLFSSNHKSLKNAYF